MHRLIAISAGLVVASLLVAEPARGALSYRFVTDVPTTPVAPNAPLAVNIYLQETATGSSTSLISAAAGNGGLGGIGFTVSRSSGAATISNVQDQTSNGQTFASGPSTITTDSPPAGSNTFPATSITLVEGPKNNATAGPNGTSAGAGILQVLCGTLTVQSGPANSTSSFSLVDFTSGNTITFSVAGNKNQHYNLDVDNANPAYSGVASNPTNFSITSTPEPASAGLLAASGLLLCRRRSAVRRIGRGAVA